MPRAQAASDRGEFVRRRLLEVPEPESKKHGQRVTGTATYVPRAGAAVLSLRLKRVGAIFTGDSANP